MDPALSKQAAKELIRNIRNSRHVDKPADENAEDLARALKLISDELYSTPTHFVLELVQNADDNKYAQGVTAKLVFLYRDDGYLWVGCNERGFTAENVRSICRFHLSTKGVEGEQKGSIGEKGIGFKSVFKVASTVWISSGSFQFRFDRDARLGMVAPVWDENPPKNSLVKENTVLCLKIPEPEDQKLVQEHLRQLEPELPLYLRNIREIQVIFEKKKSIVENYSLTRVVPKNADWDVELVKVDHKMKTEEALLRLYHVEYVAGPLPSESRREGVQYTTLQIDFPVSKTGEPELANRPLYNYLPVRAYGLPFLLNADFLLSANREDVEHGKQWNKALCQAIVELFLKSVQRFNHENILEYTWPRYLRSQASMQGTVFQPLFQDIIKRLKNEPVLKSQAGAPTFPSSLVYIPLPFTDGGSPPKPLLKDHQNLHCYLATPYTFNDLTCLGVGKLTVYSFIGGDGKVKANGLRAYITQHGEDYRTESNAWHARIALAITRQVDAHKVRDIKLIPLRDEGWIAATGKKFYFPELEQGLKIPAGINIPVIDTLCAQDQSRRALFKWLGAETLDSITVCRILLDEHKRFLDTPRFPWGRETVIAHARYLYNASKTRYLPNLDGLGLVVNGSSLLLKGSSVYMDDGSEFSVAKFIPPSSDIVKYIDPAYPISDEGVCTWLKSSVGVRTIPKCQNDADNDLSDEFKYIIRKVSSRRFLKLLMANWESYFPSFNRNSQMGKVGLSVVTCTNGAKLPLNATFLPNSKLLGVPFAKEVLPFLDIDERTDDRWKKLKGLGVCTSPDLRLYMTVLVAISVKSSLRPSKPQVEQIYKSLEDKWEDDSNESNKSILRKAAAVFVESGASFRWMKLDECVWKAPPQLCRMTALERHYPKLETLFVKHLGVQNASIGNMVDELLKCKGQIPEVENIKGLLEAINARLSMNYDDDSINRLHDARVFPTCISTGAVQLHSCLDTDWFIADTDRLRGCFEDKLLVLDFPTKDTKNTGRLEPLLKRLSLLDRRLSGVVKEKTLTTGTLDLEKNTTTSLRSKAKYIARLMPKDKFQTALKELSNIEVFCAENLTLRRSVTIGSSTIVSDDDGQVLIGKSSNKTTCMYLKATDIESGDLPTWHMHVELCKHFDIPDRHASLLSSILSINNEKNLEDMLERSGIEKDEGGAEPVEEMLMDYAEPEGKKATELCKQSTTNTTTLRRQASHELGSPIPRGSRRGGRFPGSGLGRGGRSSIPEPYHGNTQGPSFKMDASTIITAAKAFEGGRIVGLGAGAIHTGGGDGISSAAIPINDDLGAFANMSAMTETLPGVSSGRSRAPRVPRIKDVREEPESNAFQQDVGAAGEYFVFNYFKVLFNIDHSVWTSDIRTRYGFPAMTTFEGDDVDFTIKDNDSVAKFTDWLVEGGHDEAVEWKDLDVTYHVEVKTTIGECNDPFTMSNNQVNLAQQWHESSTDIFILLRVFHFTSNPEMYRFVDPYALQMAGKLKFQAQGFWVQPS